MCPVGVPSGSPASIQTLASQRQRTVIQRRRLRFVHRPQDAWHAQHSPSVRKKWCGEPSASTDAKTQIREMRRFEDIAIPKNGSVRPLVPFCCVRRSGWRLLDGFYADREGFPRKSSSVQPLTTKKCCVLSDACSHIRSAIVRCASPAGGQTGTRTIFAVSGQPSRLAAIPPPRHCSPRNWGLRNKGGIDVESVSGTAVECLQKSANLETFLGLEVRFGKDTLLLYLFVNARRSCISITLW